MYFKPEDLTTTAWAHAALRQAGAQLFMALAREAEWHLGNFKPKELANTTWTFATLGHVDVQLSMALAREAERRLGNYKPQDLANAAWASVTLGQAEALLFGVGKGRKAARGRLQSATGARQHSMCVCAVGSGSCVTLAVHGISK